MQYLSQITLDKHLIKSNFMNSLFSSSSKERTIKRIVHVEFHGNNLNIYGLIYWLVFLSQ